MDIHRQQPRLSSKNTVSPPRWCTRFCALCGFPGSAIAAWRGRSAPSAATIELALRSHHSTSSVIRSAYGARSSRNAPVAPGDASETEGVRVAPRRRSPCRLPTLCRPHCYTVGGGVLTRSVVINNGGSACQPVRDMLHQNSVGNENVDPVL